VVSEKPAAWSVSDTHFGPFVVVLHVSLRIF